MWSDASAMEEQRQDFARELARDELRRELDARAELRSRGIEGGLPRGFGR